MTEEEAKQKVCPIMSGTVQVPGVSTASGEARMAAFGELHVVKCVGSQCMAWRERAIYDIKWDDQARPYWPIDGYCGMAATP